ncbi:MAG: hypothetical protein C0448_12350 [Sphingobacteriaceae bacterium]|nr:hypothetical protein [Sphingobacteriaceae bacterium]
MNPTENLHYAIGQLAFAVAFSDGKIQKEESENFHKIVLEELNNNSYDFDVSDIIFKVMEKDKMDSNTVYDWAMKEIKTNSHYLSPQLKVKFITVMEKIAGAFPPVTNEESDIINRFKKDIKDIHGDPAYYLK